MGKGAADTIAKAAADAKKEAKLLQTDDEMCTTVESGAVAPVNGFFNGLAVSVGDVAPETGTFCVSKDVLALAQRSFGLESVEDVEKAVAAKKKDTKATTTEKAVEKKKKKE